MNYLLAEPQQEIIKKIYSGKFKQPQVNYLFDNTEMPDLKQTGPILVTDTNVDTTVFKQLLEQHSGLLITSQQPQAQVLAQLRHILFVYFKPDQIGIFRYYDPYIASYFFPSLNEQETADWLGPIESIEWYNTDWRNKVNQPDQWQEKYNPQAANWQLDTAKLKTKPVLSNNQNLALQDMQEEKFAYEWHQDKAQNTANIEIDTVIYWVKQGIKDGFTKKQPLNQYLSTRAKYPNSPAPESWPSEVIEDRIIYLEYYLKTANS